MEINNFAPDKYRLTAYHKQDDIQEKIGEVSNDEEQLRRVISQFSSILINKMFKSMRGTLPESKMIDGGFAEEIFTDMLDQEVSKQGAKQEAFSNLNRILYRQLSQNMKQNPTASTPEAQNRDRE